LKRPNLFQNPLPDYEMWIYDIECYPNYTLIKFVDQNHKMVDFEFRGSHSEIKMQSTLTDLKAFIARPKKDRVFVGFFNTGVNGYDDYMLKYFIKTEFYMITCQSIFEHSNWIIKMDNDNRPSLFWEYWRMESPWGKSIDVYNLPPQKWRTPIGQAGGLKTRAARLGWDRLQDLPYPPGTELTETQMDEVADYCINDVMMTVDQFRYSIPQVEVRLRLEDMYKDVTTIEAKPGYRGNPPKNIEHQGVALLDRHDAGVCETIFQTLYASRTNTPINHVKKLRPTLGVIKVKELLAQSKYVRSEDPEFLKVIDRWSQIEGAHENVKEALEYTFMMDDLELKVAAGGLHSVDGAANIESNDDYQMIDIDVTSYYPAIMEQNAFHPQQLTTDFVDIENELTTFRINAKNTGDKVAANGVKIVINTAYGKSASKYSFMFDPEMQLKVIMVGQLNLLALIARLQREGIKVLSANTDGILCYVHKDQRDKFTNIYQQWENRSGYNLEETHYSKYVRRDVNNYIAIDTDPNEAPKVKGVFKQVKGRAPIIADALYAYYRSGVQPQETINTCANVKNFLYYFHASRGWSMQITLHSPENEALVTTPQQSTCRWYQVNGGVQLSKWKPDDDPEKGNRVISVPDASSIEMMNDVKSYTVPPDLDRQWYIDKVWGIINDTETEETE